MGKDTQPKPRGRRPDFSGPKLEFLLNLRAGWAEAQANDTIQSFYTRASHQFVHRFPPPLPLTKSPAPDAPSPAPGVDLDAYPSTQGMTEEQVTELSVFTKAVREVSFSRYPGHYYILKSSPSDLSSGATITASRRSPNLAPPTTTTVSSPRSRVHWPRNPIGSPSSSFINRSTTRRASNRSRRPNSKRYWELGRIERREVCSRRGKKNPLRLSEYARRPPPICWWQRARHSALIWRRNMRRCIRRKSQRLRHFRNLRRLPSSMKSTFL